MSFDRIDAARRQAGLSAHALCRAAGVAYTTWWRASRGRQQPYRSTLQKLEAALAAADPMRAAGLTAAAQEGPACGPGAGPSTSSQEDAA